jgi:uncharacterized membrane protein
MIDKKFCLTLIWQLKKLNKMNENNQYNSDNYRERTSVSSDLIEKEQDYRHKWQDKFLKSHTANLRFGQSLGFLYNITLLYVVYSLISSGEKKLAVIIFALNAFIISFGLLVTTIERKVIHKKPMRKGRDDRNYKNYKNRNHARR